MSDPSRRQPSRPAPPTAFQQARRRKHPVKPSSGDDTDAARLLRIYLGDHFAGSTGGENLARRIARNHRGRVHGPALSAIADEVAQDRRSLKRIMSDLGIAPPPAKAALAWATERAGRLKPNGRLFGRSPLSSVIELETMRMGVEGKASCWRSLRAVADHDRRLSAQELDELLDRAEAQSRCLEDTRTSIAAATFSRP
ncbi:hypothetical protein OG948_40440 (plasmid) [Embleya sp. NBC_00888]|uniref:hypothetical protein n=1 Tax=Embleya sp. NBC_00888 TaxID=2975960 RepID=UPI002F914BC4|nr:hypothetical protein OG948_40440 [Embleya sp. NBC_00888]